MHATKALTNKHLMLKTQNESSGNSLELLLDWSKDFILQEIVSDIEVREKEYLIERNTNLLLSGHICYH